MISIRNLSKTFSDGVSPLKNINAEIHKGDVISLIGPSGTGKSTLLRCINKLEAPTSGQIIVDGEDLTDKKTDILKVRQKLAMVFQSFNLFSHKMVIENLMMGPMDLLGLSKQEAFDRGIKYLKMVGLASKLYSYPDELSGGQKQRVAIARCLAMEPEIILFDEPTSALDPTMVSEVQAVISELARQGLTMMIVTHDMKFSREIANRIFYMDDGVIYEEGTPNEIFDNPKNEKTRAFVKRLRTLEYEITSKDFDLYDLNARVEEFASKHIMMKLQLNSIQLVLEELIMNFIICKTHNIRLSLGFYEEDAAIEITLDYGGDQYNPFTECDGNDISMMLINKYINSYEFSFENKNKLILKI